MKIGDRTIHCPLCGTAADDLGPDEEGRWTLACDGCSAHIRIDACTVEGSTITLKTSVIGKIALPFWVFNCQFRSFHPVKTVNNQ